MSDKEPVINLARPSTTSCQTLRCWGRLSMRVVSAAGDLWHSWVGDLPLSISLGLSLRQAGLPSWQEHSAGSCYRGLNNYTIIVNYCSKPLYLIHVVNAHTFLVAVPPCSSCVPIGPSRSIHPRFCMSLRISSSRS